MIDYYSDVGEVLEERVGQFLDDLTVVVNAAGEGSRLRPYTEGKPKPLIEVGKRRKPIIYWALLPYVRTKIKRFLIFVRYQGNLIQEIFRNGRLFDSDEENGIKFEFLEEPEPLGRAGAVKYAIEKRFLDPEKPVLIMNASDILNLHINNLVRHYVWQRSTNRFEIVQVYGSGYKVQYGIGRLHPSTGQVLSFEEKPIRVEPTNMACYVVHGRLLDFLKITRLPANPEDELIYDWVKKGVVSAYVIPQEDVLTIKFEGDIQRIADLDLDSFLRPQVPAPRLLT